MTDKVKKENLRLAHLDPLLRVFDHLVTKKLGWDKAHDGVI